MDIKADVTVHRQTVVHRSDTVRDFVCSVFNTTRYNFDYDIFLFIHIKTRKYPGLIVKSVGSSALQTQLKFMSVTKIPQMTFKEAEWRQRSTITRVVPKVMSNNFL